MSEESLRFWTAFFVGFVLGGFVTLMALEVIAIIRSKKRRLEG